MDQPGKQRCHDPYLRCALYGAAQTALGITGCCVLAHSPQGCFQLVDVAFGWQDADYTETMTLCTKLCENEIVHGGEEVLARTILEARDLDVPIMFIVTACGPEIVGDDIGAVCEETRGEVDFPIVPIRCAGFRGDQNWGVDMALEAMLEQLVPGPTSLKAPGPTSLKAPVPTSLKAPVPTSLKAPDPTSLKAPVPGGGHALPSSPFPPSPPSGHIPRSVCLIAPHASANPTWMGDLAWVREILAGMGATVLATLTHGTALDEFERIPLAEGCIVLSHDAGQKAADYLAERYGIAQWCRGLPLPIGFANTRAWLSELGRRLGAEEEAQRIVAEGEAMVVKQCRLKGLEQSAMHRAPAAVVADATLGVPLLRFMAEDLEMVPTLVCLRSGQEGTPEMLERELAALGLAPRVVYHADVYQSKMALAEVRPEMVLGSNIERHAVAELDIPYVFRLVNPISRFRLTDRAYLGYVGMLNLIETIQNDWWDRYRSKRQRYKARW